MAIDPKSLAEQPSPILDTMNPSTRQPSDPPTESGSGPSIDKAKLLMAWRQNIETQSQLTETVERARRSNMLTRYIVLGVAALLVTFVGGILYHIQHEGIRIVRTVGRVEALAQASHREVVEVRGLMQGVSDSVAKTNEAELMQEEVAEHEQDQPIAPRQARKHRAVTQVKRKRAREARMQAMAATLKAQERLTTTSPEAKQQLEDRKAQLRNQAAKEGVKLGL